MNRSTADSLDGMPPAAAWGRRDLSGRRAMLAEILAQVSSEALQGETLEDVLQRIVDCVARRLPVAIASIILLDEEGASFVQEVWAGTIGLEPPGDPPWPVTVGAAGRCARSGKAQLIEDVGSDPDYVPGNVEVKSEYLVPIQHRTRLHGVLNLESTRADFFGEEVRATFDAVAAQIAGAIHLARVARALELANLRLEQLSMSDGLTGIANRRCFDHRLLLEWERHADNGRPLALLLVDVDCFKALNDAHGHLHGDECLRRIAQLCAAALDDAQGIVARYGGEEFALLLTDCAMQDAHAFAEQLRLRVEDLALCNPRSHVSTVATVSVGIGVVVPSPARDPQFLVAAADQALYSAKNEGRNRVAICLMPPHRASRA